MDPVILTAITTQELTIAGAAVGVAVALWGTVKAMATAMSKSWEARLDDKQAENQRLAKRVEYLEKRQDELLTEFKQTLDTNIRALESLSK